MSEMLEAALDYAHRGWRVLALAPRSKEPRAGSRGVLDATTDEATIRRWFADSPDSNVGIALAVSGSLGTDLMAFDIDEYHGDHHKLAGLFQRLGPLPETLAQMSGSGQGRHFIYRAPPFQIRGAVDGVVLRRNHFIVAAPSIHPTTGQPYTWVPGYGPGQIEPAELPPAWLDAVKKTARVGALDIDDDEPAWLASIPQDERIAWMRRHLGRELGEVHPSFAQPDTDPRRVRPALMFTVACTAVRGYAVRDPDVVLDAMLEIYNARCVPSYSPDKIARAVYSAYTRGEKAWGSELDPSRIPTDPEVDEMCAVVLADSAPTTAPIESARVGGTSPTLMAREALAEMQARYAWIADVGCVIDTSTAPITHLHKDKFLTTHGNQSVPVGTTTGKDGQMKTSYAKLGKWWLEHVERRTYRRIGYYAPPLVCPPNEYNTWTGFAVAAKPGDWSVIREHIEKVIAAGNRTHAEYVIRWIAWTLQNPGIPAEAALVLRGDEGTGKGAIGTLLRRVFGVHAVHVTNPDHFVGSRFNSHMAGCSFFFADECYWAGDKKHEGTLKGLITEQTIRVEPKGVNSYEVASALHVLIASNNAWVVPAGAGARRFVVLDVPSTHKGDTAYYRDLFAAINGDGAGAMLHELLAMDLGEWHPRMIVDSDALRDQKERSLSPEGEWMLMLLTDGELPGLGDPRWASTAELKLHAQQTVNVRGHDWTDMAIKSALRAVGATPKRIGSRPRGWQFPSLTDAREAWCRKWFRRAWGDDAPAAWSRGGEVDREVAC